MRRLVKILLWFLLYAVLSCAILVIFVLYWSYGEKKRIPSQVITEAEHITQRFLPGAQVFIGGADMQLTNLSQGLEINLNNTYMKMGKNINVSIPHISMSMDLNDLAHGRLNFRNMAMDNAKFVVAGNTGQQEFTNTASHDFLNLYKLIIYSLFDKIDKNGNGIPVDKIDMNNTEFSFNKSGKYETWKIDTANLRFFSLQNTTYLSTYMKTNIFGKDSEVTADARLLEKDKVLVKVDYKNMPSEIFAGFSDEFDWFNKLSPVMNGTSSMVMDRAGNATSVALDADIEFEKEEIQDTKIGFKGTMELAQNDAEVLVPKVHGEVLLKDVNMEKLPIIWPDKYAAKVREEVLKNYTKGTFQNVALNFDFIFDDTQFSHITSEKYTITGDIIDTDVIYNPNFPPVEKVDGHFSYDGVNVLVDMDSGHIGNLEFGRSKVKITGMGDPKVVMEIEGTAKGDLASLKPLLKSIFKGKDAQYYYNTHDFSSESDMKFYYKDNINKGFDPEFLKMDIEAHLTKVQMKKVLGNVDMTADEMLLRMDGNGLSLTGDAQLAGAPAHVDVSIGFTASNIIAIKVNSKMPAANLSDFAPGINDYVTGDVDMNFEYQSEGTRNYFAGKLELADSVVKFPYLAWDKPKGEFASVTFGGKVIDSKAIEISDLELVSNKTVSSGTAIISLDGETADEIYIKQLNLGNNDAEVYLNRSFSTVKNKKTPSYIVKVSGKTFDASKIFDAVSPGKKTDKAAVSFEMDVNELLLANNVVLQNTKANYHCDAVRCFSGGLTGAFKAGGNLVASLKPKTDAGVSDVREFNINSDNAGEVIRGIGFSGNIQGGTFLVEGDIGADKDSDLKGLLTMKDFHLTNTPILTKVFSLASFTGILNLFRSTGVSMKQLKGNFMVKENHLVITNLSSYGSSLGFTMQGNVNFTNSVVDLSGAVTPSYSVNTFLGNVPLLGAIFTGKRGEGLISTNYRVKGKYPDVDVSVNALSTLTPGILRNIWGEANTDIQPEAADVEAVVKPADKSAKKTTDKTTEKTVDKTKKKND